jgi:hypothetical protein
LLAYTAGSRSIELKIELHINLAETQDAVSIKHGEKKSIKGIC